MSLSKNRTPKEKGKEKRETGEWKKGGDQVKAGGPETIGDVNGEQNSIYEPVEAGEITKHLVRDG